MPTTMKRLRGPSQWFGGKAEMLDWLLPILEGIPHTTFVDGCCGMLSVLLGKRACPVEVANDVDGELVNFWRTVRDRGPELALRLLFTPYSRQEWQEGQEVSPADDELTRARKFIAVARQSMAGHWGRAWSRAIEHSRRGMSSSVSRWLHLPEDVLACCARLSTVQVEHLPVCDLIAQYSRPDTLLYLDPPYLGQEGQTLDGYRFVMTAEEHARMLDAALTSEAKFVISGYHNPLYDRLLTGWRVMERAVNCRSNVRADGGTAARPRRTEVLWARD